MTCIDARKLFVLCGNLAIVLAALATSAARPAIAKEATASATAAGSQPVDHAVVPSFERFQPDGKLDAEHGGLLLLGELNCTSCHKPSIAAAAAIQRKQTPILDAVGTRVRPSWIRQFLADPQSAKPGTPMPNLLADLPEAERKGKIEALVHFLASTGSVLDQNPDKKLIPAGKQLYHQVGCVACHGPRGIDAQSRAAAALPTTVPLGNLAAKYTVPGLAGFLLDPHKVRPSGRMPSFNLSQDESRQLASYLLEGVQVDSGDVNLNYAYYEGHWNMLPDFAALKPQAAGKVAGFDCAIAPQSNDMALRFSAFIRIDTPGDYTFYTRSDDGSKLWIDGKLAVDNDGIHAPSEKAGDPIKLTAGMHELVAGVFNAGGGVELDVEFSGAGRARQTVLPLLSLTREPPQKLKVADGSDAAFLFDGDLAAKGRNAFIALGCASCHEMSKAKPPADELIVPPALAAMKTDRGCLAASRQKGVPRFALSAPQRTALAAAIKSLSKLTAEAAAPKHVIQQTMLALNCYACHTRGGLGGVEEARDPYFETSQKEMGDEGRLPPPLDGVGAKLTTAWLKHIFAAGSKDRPYMHARMPRFGEANAGQLVAALEAVDTIQPVKAVTFSAAERQVKAAGRQIVGDKGGLGCVKCHNFRDVPSTGIQAMNLTLMPQRLKHDWFRRYVLNPQEFRPGTRMPSAWPNGQTFLPKLLDGTADSQIEAVWQYLADGDKAMVPYGLARGPIELTPEKEAIIYRNFIEGAGSRAIGVGYPEKANIAFDANDLRLALIWQGAFIDAARHWVDRGAGYQPPLGDNILALAKGPSFATLDSQSSAWPKQVTKGAGYQFRGYRLTKDDRPTFLYDVGTVHVADFPNAVAAGDNATLRRTLSLNSDAPATNLWYRAAVAQKIESLADGWYSVGGWKTRLDAPTKPILRQSEGQTELLVPVELVGGQFKLVQEYVW